MWFLGSAIAATLPTSCPTELTPLALEAYSAGIVTPAVLSATDPILTLATDYGDEDCPTPWGSPCTTSAGVEWEGTLRLDRDADGGECHGEPYTNSWTDAYADFVAGPLDGAVLTAEGTAEMETSDGCGTFTDRSSWSGSLAVSGSWGALQDDTMEGAVSSTYDDGGYWCGLETTDRWEATSGECTWQSTRLDEPCDDWHRRSTIVEVDGVQVRWDWTVYRSEDGVWGAVASITYVDGVAVSDADEVIPEEYGIERVDADGDGWSAAWDCDDGDAGRHPYGPRSARTASTRTAMTPTRAARPTRVIRPPRTRRAARTPAIATVTAGRPPTTATTPTRPSTPVRPRWTAATWTATGRGTSRPTPLDGTRRKVGVGRARRCSWSSVSGRGRGGGAGDEGR